MSAPDATVPKGGATIVPSPVGAGGEGMGGGRRTRRGASVKQLKTMLKKAGLKTTGKKASLTKRAKKAQLKMVKKGGNLASIAGTVIKGGEKLETPAPMGGKRSRRSRKGLFGKLF